VTARAVAFLKENKIRRAIVMCKAKTHETRYRPRCRADLDLQKIRKAEHPKQILACHKLMSHVFNGILRHNACWPAVELMVTAVFA